MRTSVGMVPSRKRQADLECSGPQTVTTNLAAVLAGPIWKNKIFAFFSYEGQNNNTNATGTGWYPTSSLATLAPTGSIASTFLNFPGAGVLGTLIASADCADTGLSASIIAQTSREGASTLVRRCPPTHWARRTSPITAAPNPAYGSGLSTVADIAEYTTSSPFDSNFKQYNGRLDADVTSKDHAGLCNLLGSSKYNEVQRRTGL